MTLHQYTLLLHQPWATHKNPNFRSRISRHERLDAAAMTLDHYRQLTDDGIIAESGVQKWIGLGHPQYLP